MLRRFGEERRAGWIAREIVRRRPLATTSELVAAIKAGMPAAARFGRGHPAKRTFQAIRIAVNGELEALEGALPLAWAVLPVGGRFGAISFHSLEDRRVKRSSPNRARGCICPPEIPVCVCGREPEAELLTRRALAPGPEEIEANPRSRSAHLRVAAKIGEERPRGGRLMAVAATARKPPGSGAVADDAAARAKRLRPPVRRDQGRAARRAAATAPARRAPPPEARPRPAARRPGPGPASAAAADPERRRPRARSRHLRTPA